MSDDPTPTWRDAFPGTLYDGDGMRLAGDGPDYTPALNDALPFKVVLRRYGVTDEAGELRIGDRLWLLPETFGTPPALPEDVLDELADALRAGRKVGLAARDEAAGALARDALLLLLDEGERRA
jgi:hypothetical protein